MSALARQSAARTRASLAGHLDTTEVVDRAVAAALVPFRRRIETLERELDELRALVCPPPPAAAGRDRLRQACVDMGIPISADNHILERDLARLINRSVSTVKNWRRYDGRLPSRRFAGRTEYDLAEVAMFLAARGEE